MSRSIDVSRMSKIAADSGYNVSRIAEQFDITVRQLQRNFKASLGRTPQDWLNEQRMEAAYQLLQDSDSVKEVAFELGFKQVSHFCRAVKNAYGKTPSELREDGLEKGDAFDRVERQAEFSFQMRSS